MLQLQDLRLQKKHRVNDLTGKALDFLNIFLINLVRDICSVGNLVDIVGNVICDAGEFFQLVFVDLSDVSLKIIALTNVLRLLIPLFSNFFFIAAISSGLTRTFRYNVRFFSSFISLVLLFIFLNSGS